MEIKDFKKLLAELHQLIYDNSNVCISLKIDAECRKFIKELKKLTNFIIR